MRNKLLIFLLFCAVPILFNSTVDVRSNDWQTLNEDLVIWANDLTPQEGSGLAKTASGLELAQSSGLGSYTSPAIEAPIAFNAVVPQWLVDLPHASGMEFWLRSGSSPAEWGPWQEIHPSHDWTLPDDEKIVGEMSFVPTAENTHRYIQYMFTLQREADHVEPLLRGLKLTFIDSTAGPTVEQLVKLQKTLDQRAEAEQEDNDTSLQNYPKPFVISRAAWCTDPRCIYTDGLEYHPVTHLILHHTVSSPAGDSAAQLRAFWSYHTITLDWGDIGYNFVVDIEGYIFEGHLGGDDVVGTHASGANTGSMALAMIGSFSVNEPPGKVQESIVDLFAWKADQRDIDVFGASDALPYMDWGLPHVIGHRDVYGETQCPGSEAHKLIPAIRDEVGYRIGLESPHIYVDELSSSFIKSSANWYVADLQCGHDTHAWYTWSTTDPSSAVNWGEWRPEVPLNGRYQIEAYIPYCKTSRNETEGAHYTIKHADGNSSVVISQQENLGLWASLGEYNLRAGNDNIIHLTDLTSTDSGLGLWFDGLRLLPIEVLPEVVTETPANGSWLNDRQVLFEWRIENPETVTQTTLQVATDEQFQNLVKNKELQSPVETTSYTFDRDYARLYWRVILTSESGKEIASASSHFGIDTVAPVSAVDAIFWLERNKQYLVSWSSSDATDRVKSFKVEYSVVDGGAPSWQPWLSAVSSTAAYFNEPVPGKVYAFRSQAIDSAGNVEAAHQTADINTDQAKTLPHDIMLPLIPNN